MDNRLPIQEFVLEFLIRKGVFSDHISYNPIAGDGSKRLFSRITNPDTGQSL